MELKMESLAARDGDDGRSAARREATRLMVETGCDALTRVVFSTIDRLTSGGRRWTRADPDSIAALLGEQPERVAVALRSLGRVGLTVTRRGNDGRRHVRIEWPR